MHVLLLLVTVACDTSATTSFTRSYLDITTTNASAKQQGSDQKLQEIIYSQSQFHMPPESHSVRDKVGA